MYILLAMHQRPGQTPLESVGNTPLLSLACIGRELPETVQLFAKAEWMNPGGSVKDRPAASMILDGEQRGALGPGRTIIDATSGNTGVAYAMLGAARGYRVKLCVPANTDEGLLATLRAYGAEVILTDPAQGMDGATREVQRILAASPGDYFFPDQLNNPANWKAHYEGTGSEIWEQTAGRVTHFAAGVGTGGTLVGAGRRLKELNRDVQIVCVQPSSPLHGIEGVRYLPTTIVPKIYDPAIVDETIEVETESAQAMVVRLAREEGMFVGVSAGAAVTAALEVARRLERGVVVTVLPEGGRRFIRERFWNDAPPPGART
jgi:cysteine synthase B